MMSAPAAAGPVPAHLGFLAIFNPSLSDTDETLDDQIVYYASVTSQGKSPKRRRRRDRPTDGISQEERNERLRQIGLAQGMISFSKGFAEGAAVDAIETEKSRVVIHELEPGWWILASINLNRLPLPPRLSTKSGERQEERYDYSTKEIKPTSLILSDLLRAHNVFLLHHDSSLTSLFLRTKRSKFVALLSRYWDLYMSTWNVLVHGNPARDVFGAINIAASGELGVGVGEEERGSGEREVLEGLVGRVEGLVDLVVSKFGDEVETKNKTRDADTWLGNGREPQVEDGVIFLGTGALSRRSLRNVTHWMEDLYTWGEHAYGVIDSPTSTRRAKPRRSSKAEQLPPTVVQTDVPAAAPHGEPSGAKGVDDAKPDEDGKLDKMVSYLKLGYGSYWTIPGVSGGSDASGAATPQTEDAVKKAKHTKPAHKSTPSRSAPQEESPGQFLIGLKGEIEEANESYQDENLESDDSQSDANSRTVLRTLHVELEEHAAMKARATQLNSLISQSAVSEPSLPVDKLASAFAEKLRVVVYVNRPFIFLFLFRLRTDSLAWDSLYRSLHYQLAPLRKPLLASTKYRPDRPDANTGIRDLIWNPADLTVHSTISNMPDFLGDDASSQGWTRADAVSTHAHILNIYSATRSANSTDIERTQKTSRGWWIVWTRLVERQTSAPEAKVDDDDQPPGQDEEDQRTDKINKNDKEIFLVRRSGDHATSGAVSASPATGLEAAGKLAQGIGVDTRRYIEDLLSIL